MKLLKNKKAQSMVEYAILLAVVISAFLLLQGIVKRGVSGGINEAASRMGDQYSVTNTTTVEKRSMTDVGGGTVDQFINEETGTSLDSTLTGLLDATGMEAGPVKGSIDYGAHNITSRVNQTMTSESRAETEAAKNEKFRWGEMQSEEKEDFSLTDPR